MSRPALILVLLAASAMCGCGTGGLVDGSASPAEGVPSARASVAPVSPGPTPADTEPASPTPVPTAPSAPPAAGLQQPPAAFLTVDGADATVAWPGAEGSFTWNGVGSDGPWVIPDEGRAVPSGASLRVVYEPEAVPLTWVARWAPVAADGAGDPTEGDEGRASDAISVPDTAGLWTLQVEAAFGTGQRAAWTWRVEVTP